MTPLNGLLVIVLFAVAGFFIAKLLPRPKKTSERAFYAIGVTVLVLAGFIGASTKLISIMGFTIMLSGVLQGLLLGILIRFAIERR